MIAKRSLRLRVGRPVYYAVSFSEQSTDMASKEQIKQHIAMTTKLKFDNVDAIKGDGSRKTRIMEHVKKSLG